MSRFSSRTSRLVGLAASIALVGCSRSATELVVLVESDLDVPAELSTVRAIIHDGNEGAEVPATFDLTNTPLPLSFGVLPGDGSTSVTIEVHGEGPYIAGENAPLIRRATTTFIEGKTLLLPLFLGRSCAGVTCGPTETCTERGICENAFVDSATLTEIEPGQETNRDGGRPASRDGGTPTGKILVEPTSGLTTTEAGGTATFTVQLEEEPTSYVVVGITSGTPAEGIVDQMMLTFTPLDWNLPRTVVVTGVDDRIVDGDQTYAIVLAPAASGDPNYDRVDPPDVTVTNTDDDTYGLVFEGAEGLSTTEWGEAATFSVRLSSAPTDTVILTLSSDDLTEGVVETPELTFLAEAWDVPQDIVVRGVDDEDADGAVAYGIVIETSSSTDADYAAIDPITVSLTNADDETAGITVSPSAGLVTDETGAEATFTVAINTRPSQPVTVDFASADPTEGTVAPTRVVFDSNNWRDAVTITVTGVDDELADGDVDYLVTSTIDTQDPDYSAVTSPSVSVTNVDDDASGVVITPTIGLVTNEDGTTASFTVRLRSEPSADVTIDLTSSDPSEGTVAPQRLVFDTTNWSRTVTVVVTGVDDDVVDGPVAYTIVTSLSTTDPTYASIDPPDVQAINTDDDAPGVIVAPTAGLVVGEDGATATFTVRLATMPQATVSFGLSSSDTGEATVSPSSVTFTAANWNTPQTVTVTGVDDDVQDGDVMLTIVTAATTSADTTYAGFDPADVTVTNEDDDTAEIIVTAGAMLRTTEAGGTATFTVRLGTQPLATVTIGLSSSNTSEGTVAPTTLTFTAANWNTPQTVTVTGVDDDIDDGNTTYTIITAPAVSNGADYAALDAANVTISNTDDDTGGVTVTPTGNLVVSETGTTVTLGVVLDTQPTAPVTATIQTTGRSGQLTAAPAMRTFTAANWDTVQNFTLSTADDDTLDGDATVQVTVALASSDTVYSGMTSSARAVTSVDDGTLPATNISDPSTPAGNVVGAPAISDDGRVVAFVSTRSDLVTGDTNNVQDVFVFSRATADYERISVATSGAQANGASSNPTISADGRYVAFDSAATNLVTGDTNARRDVFVHDRQTNITTRASVGPGGAFSTQHSDQPAISASGDDIAFVAGSGIAPTGHCIAVRDRAAGTTSGGGVGTNPCGAPKISQDGQFVVFTSSTGMGLVLRNTTASSQSAVGPASATRPYLTPSARYLGYTADNSTRTDVYVLDRTTSMTSLLSASASGSAANGDSTAVALSADGRWAIFVSDATNLVSPATPATTNLFRRDRMTDATTLLATGVSSAAAPAISGDGRFVAYVSASSPSALYLRSR